MKLAFSDLEDDFYSIVISNRTTHPGPCRALASIHRKDSGEEIGCLVVKDNAEELALRRLREQLPAYLASFSRPPYQWGRVELRKLILDYLQHNKELISHLMELEKLRERGSLSAERLQEAFILTRWIAEKAGASFSSRLMKLSEQDQVDLMTSSEDAYKDSTDPWNLDDISARSALFKFIESPSAAVTKAHELHLSRLS